MKTSIIDIFLDDQQQTSKDLESMEKFLELPQSISKIIQFEKNIKEYMDIITDLESRLKELTTPSQFTKIKDTISSSVIAGKYPKALLMALNVIKAKGVNDLLETLKSIQQEQRKNKIQPPFETTVQALNSIIPENAYLNNSKIVNEMIKSDFLFNKIVPLAVEKRGSKKEITTFATMNYEADNISLTGRFTPYDREIHDAVCTLHIAGNKMFTAEMVYRAMNGLTNTEYIKPQAIGSVTRSIEKSRFTKLTIDFTQEAKARSLDINNATFSDMLLSVEEISVSTGGAIKRAYAFNKEPILYRYSSQIGQVISVPINLLETKNALRSSSEVVVLRGYLLRRIEGMKHKNRLRSSRIKYESIYEHIELTDTEKYAKKPIATDKDKSGKVKKHVKALLQYWQDQKYIKSFEEYKEGRTTKGVTITY